VALQARPLIVDGKFWGAVYTLEYVDDVFPIHVHSEETNHITILTHGSVRVLGQHDGTVLTAQPGGTIVNWIAGEPHGFVALTDGATLVNIRKQSGIRSDEVT